MYKFIDGFLHGFVFNFDLSCLCGIDWYLLGEGVGKVTCVLSLIVLVVYYLGKNMPD